MRHSIKLEHVKVRAHPDSVGTGRCSKQRSLTLHQCRLMKQERSAAAVVELADVMLGIELEAELAHQIELRLEEVDVLFLVVHQLLEQVAGDVILDRMTMRRRLLVE